MSAWLCPCTQAVAAAASAAVPSSISSLSSSTLDSASYVATVFSAGM